MGNLESGNDVPLNEPLCIQVSNISKWLGFNPLYEVNSPDEKPSSVSSSFGKWFHYVQALLGKRPRTREWIQDPSRLMNIQGILLTLITLLNIILGSFLRIWPRIFLGESSVR